MKINKKKFMNLYILGSRGRVIAIAQASYKKDFVL